MCNVMVRYFKRIYKIQGNEIQSIYEQADPSRSEKSELSRSEMDQEYWIRHS